MDNIKDILILNGYPEDLIEMVFQSHHNYLNNPKVYGPEKFPVVLKLPYIGETSCVFELRIK